MTTHVRCGTLFAGNDAIALKNHTLCFDVRGEIAYVGPTREAPPVAARRRRCSTTAISSSCLALQDVHTHLAYGNAKSEEDIDLYQPMEFRSLRGLFFAQKVLAAGYTSICSPGDAGQISLSVRNAINFGLFDGPRVTAAGPLPHHAPGPD